MPINFPDNPTEGTQHTVGGITWQYDYSNAVWNVVTGGSAFRVSATAPSSPVVGDLWYDTESGEMFIYYDSAWVSPSVVATVAASVEVSATAPTAPAIGDLWFDSNTGDLTIYYDSQWVSPSVVASLATASASTITHTNSEGTSTSFARADHNHQIQAVGAFSAYFSGSRSLISTGAYLDFDAEDYDVNNWHDSTGTRGQYTPQKAGYYRLGVYWDAQALTTNSFYDVILRKNTVDTGRFLILEQAGHPSYPFGRAEIVVYANGTTDTFRVFAYHTSTSNRTLTTGSGVYACRFYGHYLGAA